MVRNRFALLGLALLATLVAGCSPGTKSAPGAPASSGSTANKPTTFAEIVAYQGADRQQVLEEGARVEGKLTFYTTLAGDVIEGLTKGFEQKYPYIKTDVFRADTSGVQARLVEESRAKKYTADVTETGQDQALVLRDEAKVLLPYYTPEAKNRPPEGKSSAKGELSYWVLDSESYVGFAYNTTALPETAVPKTWRDLLNPALKGKMQVAGTSTGVTWAGNLLTNQGEAFVQQVAKQQDMKVQQVSGKALLDLIASGEVIASPAIYRDHALQAIEKGAPVKWVPLEPVTTGPYAVTLINNLPHPHAALLFADFVLSKEGQKVMETYHYGSSSNDAGFARWRAAQGLSAAEYQQKYAQWQDFFTKQFVQK